MAANQVVCSAINPTKCIIAQVAVVESQINESLEIKAAKDANGLTALSTDELAGLQTYLNRIKIAGMLVNATSGNAVPVRYNVNVEVDKSVLNGQAERIDGTTTTPVQDSLEAFHQSLKFNGTNSVMQTIAVTVTDVNDNDPIITSPATASVAENTTDAVLTVTAIDADTSTTLTYSISEGG